MEERVGGGDVYQHELKGHELEAASVEGTEHNIKSFRYTPED